MAVVVSLQPWLEHNRGIADPILPVTSDDTRPSVEELIAQLYAPSPIIPPRRSFVSCPNLRRLVDSPLSHKSRVQNIVLSSRATLAYRQHYHLATIDLRHCNVEETSTPAVPALFALPIRSDT